MNAQPIPQVSFKGDWGALTQQAKFANRILFTLLAKECVSLKSVFISVIYRKISLISPKNEGDFIFSYFVPNWREVALLICSQVRHKLNAFTKWQAVQSGTTLLIFAKLTSSHFTKTLVGEASPNPFEHQLR